MKKIKFKFAGREFYLSVFILCVYVLLMGLLISLGNWQLRRSDEKRQYLNEQQIALGGEVIDLSTYENPQLEALEYKKVVVQGEYDSKHQFLLDNQIVKGKVGYFVLTPLKIKSRPYAVLVNRGWIEMDKDRTVLPDISIQGGPVSIEGRVNHFPRVAYQLEGADIPAEHWPSVVQVINPEILSRMLGYPVLDFQLELAPELPQGYIRDWQIKTTITPEKHIAYAMQWYGLALTLTCLMIWLGFKNNHE